MKPDLFLKSFQSRRGWIPYFVLAIALLFTGATATYVTTTAKAKDKLRFEYSAERTQEDIKTRFETYITLSRASSGLFAASDRLSRAEFAAFVNRLRLKERYPGVQGIGFSVRVQPGQKAALVQALQQQGIENFKIRPDFPRNEYHAIIYLEPLDRRNRAAIGYDMFSEKVRRDAMSRARDTGEPAASGKVTLLQEIDKQKQAGFLLYIPVYRNGKIPNNIAQRQKDLIGFVYSPFRADDLIQGVFGDEKLADIDFKIYEGKNISPEHLLHISKATANNPNYQPSLRQVSTIDIAGQTWSIVYNSRPEFDSSSENRLVPYIGFVGVAIALILFGVTRSLVIARNAAEKSSEELRESSTRLRFALDAAQLGDWDLDLATKTARRSLQHDRVFGHDTLLPDWSYEIFLSRIHPEDREYVDRQFQRTLATNIDWEFECRVVWDDKSIHWVWATGSVYRNKDGKPGRLIGIVKEISDRKLLQEALKQKAVEQEVLLNSIPAIVYYKDLQAKYIAINRQGAEVINKPIAEIIGKTDNDLFPQDQATAFYNDDRQVMDLGLPKRSIEEAVTGADGKTMWVITYKTPYFDPQAKVAGLVGITLDISDRKRAEIERDRFFTLSLDLLCIAGFDGYLKRINPAFEKILGYTLQEILNKPFFDFIHPEDINITINEVNKLAQGRSTVYFENRYQCKDGSYRWLSWATVPVVEEGLMYATAHDITTRKAAEIERERLLESEKSARTTAEAANRMKDEFLATLSHELRTPLNAMVGWIQLLRTRKFDTATTAKALETIDRNTKSLQQLIEDILDVSRIITGKIRLDFAYIALQPVVESAIETVKSAAEAKNIRLEFYVTPGINLVLADPNRLQQVLWNLLSNAVKFTPKDGRVEVRLEVHSSRVQISIKDSGQGISSEFLPYVFERFRQEDGTTTRTYGGLGLGLAIVRHLVELHGGTVKAESEGMGKGSTFIVTLPINSVMSLVKEAPPKMLVVASEPAIICLPSLEDLRVLVVDDESDARELISTVLQEYGAKVKTVATAKEALTQVTQFQPDVLVSDIGMPEVDGYTLIEQVRARSPEQGGNVPALALTAYARAEDRTRALLAGFQLHVPKPIDSVELAVAIARLAGRTV
ncbi:CHASE domain-containing protein [Synechocystis sp. PCC 7509]|uniref:CHASE domain-containing protein n=1 Tax=Synechocystis sp. PCC 7509 TaxID=927677 RepID=UPI0002AC9A7A|nr:CHASE domain-containing protein [Synechocystis sp. PCC 7509]